MTEKLEHIGFLVHDLNAAIAFYEKLGFSEHFALKKSNGDPWITYIRSKEDGLFLELVVNYDVDEIKTHQHAIVLTVDNLEKAALELEQEEIAVAENDGTQIVIMDPDQNRIVLRRNGNGI